MCTTPNRSGAFVRIGWTKAPLVRFRRAYEEAVAVANGTLSHVSTRGSCGLTVTRR